VKPEEGRYGMNIVVAVLGWVSTGAIAAAIVLTCIAGDMRAWAKKKVLIVAATWTIFSGITPFAIATLIYSESEDGAHMFGLGLTYAILSGIALVLGVFVTITTFSLKRRPPA
jgi:hypothetical protein